jgi:hypothetical protein
MRKILLYYETETIHAKEGESELKTVFNPQKASFTFSKNPQFLDAF